MAFTPQQLQGGFCIGECLIEPRQNRIVCSGSELHLESRVMDVLVCLAGHAGEVISRETLNAQVWGNVVVTDQAVTNCISELRRHLGDGPTNRIIETIPKRGYRLTAPVQLAGVEAPKRAPSRKPGLVAAGLLILATVAFGSTWWWWWQGASTPACSRSFECPPLAGPAAARARMEVVRQTANPLMLMTEVLL
jgi:DNA-binding winged helix-turn-helix (wHTH) protein